MASLRFTLNKAAFIAYNTAEAAVRRGIYQRILEDAAVNYSGIADFNLSLDNKPSKHSMSDPRYVKRNNLVLKTWDEAVEIEFESVFTNVIQSNTIVKTPLAGRKGSFKELIQANDYQVTINGSIYSDSGNAFPIYQLVALKKILEQSKRVKVANVYLQLFGITEMVFQTGSHKLSKFVNAMDFNLKFLSDEEFSLYVEE